MSSLHRMEMWAAIVLLTYSSTVYAQSPIPIADPSFENVTQNNPNTFIILGGGPPATSGQFANPGWSWMRSGFDINVTVPPLLNVDITTFPGVGQVASALATDGNNVGRFSYTPLTGGLLGIVQVQTFGSVGISQTTSANVAANTQYSFAIDLDRSTTAALLNSFTVTLTDNGTPFVTRGFASLLTLLDRPSGLDTVGFQFTTGAVVGGGNLGIEISANFPLGAGTVFDLLPNGEINFDAASLTAVAVPEPATLALIGLSVLGGAGGYWRYRRNRKQQLDTVVCTEEE